MKIFERNDTPASHLDPAHQSKCVVKLFPTRKAFRVFIRSSVRGPSHWSLVLQHSSQREKAWMLSLHWSFQHHFTSNTSSAQRNQVYQKWKSGSSKVLILWSPSITPKIWSEALKQAKELKSKSSIDQLHFPINILRSFYRVDGANYNFHPYTCEMTKQSKLMTDQHLPLIIPWRIALPFRTSLFFIIFPLQITVFPIKRHSRLYPGVLHH